MWQHPLVSQSPLGDVGYFDYNIAKERGRQMALASLFNDEPKKAEMEIMFGTEAMKRQYPELYQ
jgi:hypothetical protein